MKRAVLAVIHFFGRGLGWLAHITGSEYARVARININLVFPELSAAEAQLLYRRSMAELGKLTLEMLLNCCLPGGFLKKQIRQIHGETHFQRALAEKRGIVLIMPHLGNWEVLNLFVGHHGPYALYRPIENRFWDKMVTRSRERPGTRMVPFTVSGVRRLYHVLEQNGIIEVLPDQLPDGPGMVVVDFLNVPARTGTMVSRMVQKTRPAVICCYARRLPRARGFDIHLMPALEGVYAPDLTAATAALNKSMDLLIKLSPEQYLWGYKRFKYTVDPGLYSRNRSPAKNSE